MRAPLFAFTLATLPFAQAADWPHWLGPNGDNSAPAEAFEPDLGKWKEAWKAEVGHGYSAITVAGDHAYTMGHDGDKTETVYCLNAATGKEIWKHAYPAELLAKMHPGGPNASATVEGDRVYTMSKDGQIFCFQATDGKVLWQATLQEILEIELPAWGYASSPVIDDGHLYLTAGKVAMLDATNGKTLWTSKSTNHPGYTTPVVFTQNAEKYVAALDGKGITVLSATDGKELDRVPFKAQFDMVACTPIVQENGTRIFIAGNLSSEMLAFDGKKLNSLWSSKDFKNAMNNSVPKGDLLIGIDGKQGSRTSRLAAVSTEDGSVKWSLENFGYGNTIGIGTKGLLALTENGELVAGNVEPSGFKEASRRQVLSKTCWTTPVLAGGRLFVRNDAGTVVCLTSQ